MWQLGVYIIDRILPHLDRKPADRALRRSPPTRANCTITVAGCPTFLPRWPVSRGAGSQQPAPSSQLGFEPTERYAPCSLASPSLEARSCPVRGKIVAAG